MIFYDFEVFKHEWLVVWLDTNTRKYQYIVNDANQLHEFYNKYKNTVLVGYNSRGYDQWVLKAILCGFDAYDMSRWIVEKNQKGHEYSRLLFDYPVMNYDCSFGFRSLKECEAFMGHDIRETSVPFNIDRKLTADEIQSTLKYCKHDVQETFEVFVETGVEWESHLGLIQEFSLPMKYISKTKAQLSAVILGAVKRFWNDEFDIKFPDTIQLGRYEYVKDYYDHWAKEVKNYDTMSLVTEINGVEHSYGIGGLHGARKNYIGEGYFLLADVGSFYPAIMIEYDFLSRNVRDKNKFKMIRDDRLELKSKEDPREKPRKIVINSTFGASKDPYNALYDPQMSNNVCIAGQLLLTDLLDKLYEKCELIQTNTDGILVKLYRKSDRDAIIAICEDWCARTRMTMDYDDYTKVFQRDVNNYVLVDSNGNTKRKGAVVKKLSKLDNNLPIVNRAVVEYLLNGTPVEQTVLASNSFIDFQYVTKITSKYDFGFHERADGNDFFGGKRGIFLNEKVHRCFASKNKSDGAVFKKHREKDTLDKTAGTPEHAFIVNENVLDKPCPDNLDKQWYIQAAMNELTKFV